ncbi:putative Lysophospholipid acyltransferase 7 [Cardiosporidium cionae]|uniref:Lysophospholipid acyltransferase 7 n=1 Tax=Cardiosporidium cionae TaxID=476202 RepID=A0ABQ7J8R2_9APIC|nr:putative Lysophospholipid acyltransferase 7 [Cardiosporidium cionae]|eukprot:KAF8820388.1 putative Lysophospholipid acyltransferase 7 [Cardiosporidium cionae]
MAVALFVSSAFALRKDKTVETSQSCAVVQLQIINSCNNFVGAFFIPFFSPGLWKRKVYCTTAGFLTLWLFCGIGIIHLIICSFASYAIAILLRKTYYGGISVFFLSFTYVGFVRYASNYQWFLMTEPLNTCFLILCFKLVHFSYFVGDRAKMKPVNMVISSIDDKMAKFRSSNAEKIGENVINPQEPSIASSSDASPTLWNFIHYICFFPADTLFDPLFTNKSFFSKLGFIWVIVFHRRSRYIIAWFLSELAVTVAAVAYDVSSPSKICEKLVVAVDIPNVEFALSIKTVVRAWNCTVQAWLVQHIYRKCSFRNPFFRKLAVLVVSAYWHGLECGYYVAFISFGIAQTIQDLMWNRGCSKSVHPLIATLLVLVKWVTTQLLMLFSTIPFVFFRPQEFLYLWRETYFFGIFIWMAIALLVWYFPSNARASPPFYEDKNVCTAVKSIYSSAMNPIKGLKKA